MSEEQPKIVEEVESSENTPEVEEQNSQPEKEEELNQSVQEESKEEEQSTPEKPKQEVKKVVEEEKKPAVSEEKKETKTVAKKEEKEEKEPAKLVDRTKFRLKKMMKNSKKLEEMEFKDFFLWKNPVWSGIVFLAIQGTLILLSSGYSVLSVLCAVFLLQLSQSVAFLILEKMGKKSEFLPQVIRIQPETVNEYLDNFKKQLNCAVSGYVDLLTFTNPQNTAIAAMGALFFGYFFSGISGLFLLGMVNAGAFLAPLSWILFDKELVKGAEVAKEKFQKVLGKSLEKVQVYVSKAVAKIPKADSKKKIKQN